MICPLHHYEFKLPPPSVAIHVAADLHGCPSTRLSTLPSIYAGSPLRLVPPLCGRPSKPGSLYAAVPSTPMSLSSLYAGVSLHLRHLRCRPAAVSLTTPKFASVTSTPASLYTAFSCAYA